MELPQGYTNIPRIIKVLGRTFRLHSKALAYLGYEGKPYGNTLIYPVECIEALQKFYGEHTDTKTFFYNLSCMERYGVTHASKSEDIKEKKRETARKHYGVDHPAQSKEVMQRIRETNLKRYGSVCTLHNDEIHEKAVDTFREKYGCDNPMQNVAIKNKLCDDNFRRFGNKSSLHGSNQQNSIVARKVALEKDKAELSEKFGVLYSFNELSDMFDRDITTIFKVVSLLNIQKIKGKVFYVSESDCHRLRDYFSRTEYAVSSFAEKTLAEFVMESYKGSVLLNVRNILDKNKELDIYVPEKRVAIEFDGLYWHSELCFLRETGKISKEDKQMLKYKHLRKTEECRSKGIRLIHLFEDEWDYKKDICQSVILSALGIYKERIYARKCCVKELTKEVFDTFMTDNHLQGTSNTHYRLGLFFGDRLVQCMGFVRNTHKTGEIELNRMATVLNTQVVGGFSKLLEHAVRLYGFSEIYSYVADRLYDGKGYASVGFEFVHRNEPTYFYVRNAMKRYPRYDFKRKDIERKYNEGKLSYWNPTDTEEMNMQMNGYGRIWDCGTTKVVYRKIR